METWALSLFVLERGKAMTKTFNKTWNNTDARYILSHPEMTDEELSKALMKTKSEVKKKRRELMKTNSGVMVVDKDRFESIMEGMGHSNSDICSMIGRNRKYLDVKLRDGVFSKSDVAMIEAATGVKYDEYKDGWDDVPEHEEGELKIVAMVTEKNKFKKWTDEEDHRLVDLYKDHNAGEVADILGRTTAAVNTRLRTLREEGVIMERKRSVDSRGTKHSKPHNMANYTEIDGLKLKAAIAASGDKYYDVAKKLGINAGSLSTWIGRNYIPNSLLLGLKTYYNVTPEDLKPSKMPVERAESLVEDIVENKGAILTEEDHKRLYGTIYAAVYEAMRQALNG